MINQQYVRRMAAYNAWQNLSIFKSADGLDDEDRKRDRGAFFGSIHAALNHPIWADVAWMHRLAQTL